jgi:hypothetical protein
LIQNAMAGMTVCWSSNARLAGFEKALREKVTMSDGRQGEIQGATEGGVSGEHPSSSPFEILVGPTTSDQFNTAHLRLIPIACWRVDDIRFAFDSSFVTADPTSDPTNRNDIRAEFSHLIELVKLHPGCPVSIFGHADPVGTDVYNKALSGRRAMSIYALLIFHSESDEAVGLWKQIASTEHWGDEQRGIMEQVTGLPARTPDGKLIRQYMENICPPDLTLTKQDFLAHGADAHGKGDYQGCSEFNPMLIFSQEKQAQFDQAEQRNDSEQMLDRNEQNEINRRVMVLMFRKGSRVDPHQWPCPRASEGVAGCIKRFWSNGETRRSTHLPNHIDRNFNDKKDTFACRFYQRISDQSPCHGAVRFARVRLYDGFEQFIPFAPFEATLVNQEPIKGSANGEGIAILDNVILPASCEIRWGYKPERGEQPELLFGRTIFLVAADEEGDEAAHKKLNNLGYHDDDIATNIAGFQLDYGHLTDPFLSTTGEFDSRTLDLLGKVYAEAANDLRRPQS